MQWKRKKIVEKCEIDFYQENKYVQLKNLQKMPQRMA